MSVAALEQTLEALLVDHDYSTVRAALDRVAHRTRPSLPDIVFADLAARVLRTRSALPLARTLRLVNKRFYRRLPWPLRRAVEPPRRIH